MKNQQPMKENIRKPLPCNPNDLLVPFLNRAKRKGYKHIIVAKVKDVENEMEYVDQIYAIDHNPDMIIELVNLFSDTHYICIKTINDAIKIINSPIKNLEILERSLSDALSREDFEAAAKLRDEIASFKR